jgi:rhamnosyltransferase
MERVFACVTLYGDKEGLLTLAGALETQTTPVGALLVIDNSPEPLFPPGSSVGAFEAVSLHYEHHPENLGVSGALARALEFANEREFTHAWFFDQDSIPSSGALTALLAAQGSDPLIALACCLPVVEPDGAPLHGLVFDRFRFVRPLRAESASLPFYDCDASITSGTLARLGALRGFEVLRRDLFIDGVDHDMCLRVRAAGRRVVVVPAATMRHALGATVIVQTRFPARTLRLPHYSALRLYYICRNHTWLELRASAGLWRFACLAWRLKYMLWQAFVVLHEEGPARAKAAACVRGTFHGIRGRLGKV